MESASSKTLALAAPLHALGFELDELSPQRVTGHLKVTQPCCQPFQVLHGGVSALVAEGLASIGAYAACGFKRVAGVQLTVNHLNSARMGDDVFAEAQPVQVANNTLLQLWEVKLWKIMPSTSGKRVLISTSRVTLLSNLPVPKADPAETMKQHYKL